MKYMIIVMTKYSQITAIKGRLSSAMTSENRVFFYFSIPLIAKACNLGLIDCRI